VSFARLLAFEALQAEAGRARLRATVGPEHVNMHGSAHGGFLYSLADEAFAVASNSREADAVALSVTMDYFRAVFPGDVLEARASEEHLGRRVATYRVEVLRERPDEDGHVDTEPVALFLGTVYRRERRAEGA
jgi:acyl-CoA thioesterase